MTRIYNQVTVVNRHDIDEELLKEMRAGVRDKLIAEGYVVLDVRSDIADEIVTRPQRRRWWQRRPKQDPDLTLVRIQADVQPR